MPDRRVDEPLQRAYGRRAMWSTAFHAFADELRRAWPDPGSLREVEERIEKGEGLTPGEREILLKRTGEEVVAADRASVFRDVPTDELMAMAEVGLRAAAAELDRRGVTPPEAELGPPPVAAV